MDADRIKRAERMAPLVEDMKKELIDALMKMDDKKVERLNAALVAADVPPADGMPALMFIIGQNLSRSELEPLEKLVYATALGAVLIEVATRRLSKD